jgi:hypothetical protein
MTQVTRHFPQKFQDLERWLPWALEKESERNAMRARSTLKDVAEFCAAVQPHMEDLIQYLGKIAWGTPLGPEDENLYRLGLAYMEATIPIDLGWKKSVAEDSLSVERLILADRR